MAVAAALLLAGACGQAPTYATTASAPDAANPVACGGAAAVTAQPAGASDWPLYNRAGDRHGVDQSLAKVAGKPAPLWGLSLDGSMFAQPLVVQGVLIEATEHDSVYALDAATGCQYWRTSLGTPFDVRKHPPLQCNNIEPELGITSTPAIDPATRTIYVVVYLDPGRYEMDALDLATGALRWRHPIDLPGSDALQTLSRPAVLVAGGRAYASFGGRAGDCGNYHGFVIGVRTDGRGPDAVFQASPNREGAIWATAGPVLMANGDLLVATSNTDQTDQYDGSDAVVRLSPDLRRLDFFAPTNWRDLNKQDLDLGAVNPTLIDDHRVFQVGKEGVGYLLDADHLGGIGGQKYAHAVGGGCYATGATAYRAPYVYVPCDHSLTAVKIGASRFDVAWRGPDFHGGSPIVSGGLVWTYDYLNGFVWAFDPASGAVRQKVEVGIGEHFVSLGTSGGRLYVPAKQHLYAFRIG